MRESFLDLSCAGYVPRNLVDECVKKHTVSPVPPRVSCGVSGPHHLTSEQAQQYSTAATLDRLPIVCYPLCLDVTSKHLRQSGNTYRDHEKQHLLR
jgi:hypothetical protein